MEGKGWRSPLGPLRGFAADNGPCCGEMGSRRAARCRRPSHAAAARWSPLPHLPLPSCQPCTAPHPGVTKWGKCLPRARGGGSPPKTPVQILQGGVQPCPPKPAPWGVPALFAPLGPGQAGAALGEWGCWCVGRPHFRAVKAIPAALFLPRASAGGPCSETFSHPHSEPHLQPQCLLD